MANGNINEGKISATLIKRFRNTLASAFAVNSITIHGNIFGKIAHLTLLVHPIYTVGNTACT